VAALRFKLDENIPVDAAPVLTAAGYDCHTVYDERLAGAPDGDVARACRDEGRVLVTLDLDFSDVRAYPPGTHPGIIVLRPRTPDRDSTLALVERVVPLFASESPEGCLWIVDAERVRVRSPRAAG
jgi:predicted nuclease of predicted toxin-antitoxin system